MAMFYKDTAGKMNVVNPLAADDEANLGLKARYEFTKESHTVDMMGPIHRDIFFQDRLMLNEVNLRIKRFANNYFCKNLLKAMGTCGFLLASFYCILTGPR